MFRLVTGVSKSGKTEYVRNYLSLLSTQGNDKLLMIVPDQQTFDTEKAFLELLGPQKAQNVKVFGFSRLCDYVFEQTGYVPATLADESVKTLLMSMALEDTADTMHLYSEKAATPHMLKTMLSLQKELKASKVTPELLRNIRTDDNKILSDKLYDAQLVLSAYDALLTASFEDPDSELTIAAELLLRHRVFQDYFISVDSYLSFTVPELDIIRILMNQAKEILVTLSDNGKDDEDSIFAVSRNTGKKLLSFAKEDNIEISTPIRCDYKEFFTKPELLFLENNIFSRESCMLSMEMDINDSPVNLYCADDTYDECDFVSRKIRELVMTKGYCYKDIAVVSRDMSAYHGILDTILSKYNISHFMDTPGYIHSKPLVKLINACFECITTSFSKDAVLSLLKTGLTAAEDTTISMFENYVFTWGISGTKFYNEFKANPRGFAEEFSSDDLFELSKIESLRKFIIEPLLSFRDKIKDATGEVICCELYNLLLLLDTDKKILELCKKYEEQGCEQLSEEQIRLWQVFTDTLDRTISVIGDRVVSPKRFAELLKLQFSAQDMAFIPRAADQVIVGDIERLRLADKKIVFVIGAEEGRFPASPINSGLFTPSERIYLSETGVLSDNSVHLESLREEYLCYYALTSASDYLYVSYTSGSLKGAPVYPSEIISKLQMLFTNLSEVRSSDVNVLDRLWAPSPSFSLYASRIGSKDKLTTALEKYYTESPEYKASASALKRAVNRHNFRITDTNIAQSLFGKNMKISASQVEKYHLCRFRYFCNYGLRIRERKVAQIDSAEYGSLIHYILEHFIKKYKKADLLGMSQDDVFAEIKEIVNEYARIHFGGLQDKTQRFVYLLNRVVVYSAKVVEHLISELLQSSFTPAEFEFDIGKDIPAYKLTLPTGQTVTITGKVDRVDLMEKDGRTYIRIVDYKTSEKVFDLSDVIYGLNLQMLIYLSVLAKNSKEHFGREVIPSGVLYMTSMLSIVSAAFSDSEESINKELRKSMKMNGLILRDMDVLEGMERQLEGIYIPVYVKKGELKGGDNLATLEEFGAIFSRIDALVTDMANELYKGEIQAVPTKGGTDACKYCPYSAVCGYKDTDPYRNVYKLEKARILAELGVEEEVTP